MNNAEMMNYVKSLPVGTSFKAVRSVPFHTAGDFKDLIQDDIVKIVEKLVEEELVVIEVQRLDTTRHWGYFWQCVFDWAACEKHFV